MKACTMPRCVQRLAAPALLLSLLPMVAFFGHWPEMSFAVPGTGLELRVPFSGPPPGAGGGHAHTDGAAHSHGDDHEAHCHASAASCAETRVGGAAPVTMLLETVLLLLGTGAWVAVRARERDGLRPAMLDMTDPPPRGSSLALRPV